jgi:hypothetical protein
MFENLIQSLTDLLDRKIDYARNMWQKEQLRETRGNVAEAKTFEELDLALAPAAKFDRGIGIRLADLQRTAAERIWLSDSSQSFLLNWYAQQAEDYRGTKAIAQMVSVVQQALAAADKPEAKEPNTGRWHANQCKLWELERIS